MKLLKFRTRSTETFDDVAELVEMWSATLPRVYDVGSDYLHDLEVAAGYTQGAGMVVQLLGKQLSPVEAERLRGLLAAAIAAISECQDPNCPEHPRSTPCTDSRCLGYCAPLGAVAGTLEETE